MTIKKENYRPLPDSLTIKESKIEGLGLFALEPIAKGTNLGITHVDHDGLLNLEKDLIRTPLGGFINHSEKPNCELVWMHFGYKLWTLEDIKKGEELTLKYKMYNPIEINK